jgi:D-lyxose ketol-isomerase
MKRSEINALIREAKSFLAQHQFHLPPFAFWTPADWRRRGAESREIVAHQLGWDITDFGRGNYADYGLLLFTIRNGRPGAVGAAAKKTYCEKVLLAKERQKTPAHCHHAKVEDIINRGGGNLQVQLWNSRPDGQRDTTPVTVSTDGVVRTLPAGGLVTLTPGESITLVDGLLHEFWGEPGRGMVLVGEVSKVNDDAGDNFFCEPTGRFPAIVEDEAPLHYMVGDYAGLTHLR